MGETRRMKYTNEVMETIRNLVKSGYTNSQIYEYFDLPPMYGSMAQKLTAVRRELNCYADKKKSKSLPALKKIDEDVEKSVVIDKEVVQETSISSNDIKFVANFVNECDIASVQLVNAINSKVADGFASSDISLSETNSKRISVIISRLENVMFLLDNITSLKEKG